LGRQQLHQPLQPTLVAQGIAQQFRSSQPAGHILSQPHRLNPLLHLLAVCYSWCGRPQLGNVWVWRDGTWVLQRVTC
jgi:hypothetical protein